jgi:predicted SprT family Zn-dependent metalloprotease
MSNVIKDYLNTIEPLVSTFATIKTVDVIKMLHKIEEYHESELKKLRVDDVSVCACGSTKYYSEQYKDVTKYFCSNCHEKIKSKN